MRDGEDATCARCLAPIERTQPRIAASPMHSMLRERVFVLHMACALDVDTRRFIELLALERSSFEGRDRLEALAAIRMRAIDDRRDRQWTAATAGYGRAIAPALAADAPLPPQSPAHDALGRPRVSVCVLGTSNVLEPKKSGSFWDRLRVAQSWSSPKREYVFYAGSRFQQLDPAQPTVAYVYATIAKRSSSREPTVGLWKQRALGFPPPLLWLIGIKQWKKSDENVLAVREHLASFGLDPDASPALCATKLDDAALDALVLALDEHFDGRELSFEGAPATKLALALESDLTSGATFSSDQLTQLVALSLTASTDESVASNERAARWLIAHAKLEDAATMLAYQRQTSRETFESWFAAALTHPATRDGDRGLIEAATCAMIRAYATQDRAACVRAGLALFAVVEDSQLPPARLKQLRLQLAVFARSSDLAVIRAAIEAAPTEAHRQELALLERSAQGRPA